MSKHLRNEAPTVIEKIRRRLYRSGDRPLPIREAHVARTSGNALSTRHPIEDDGWITILPRPWDAERHGRNDRDDR